MNAATKLKTMAECIEDGIRLLDEKRPGWLDKIDLSRFKIASDCNCVLGQIEGSYAAAMDALGLGWGSPFGFDMASRWLGEELGVVPSEYPELQEAWLRRLIELKAKRGLNA